MDRIIADSPYLGTFPVGPSRPSPSYARPWPLHHPSVGHLRLPALRASGLLRRLETDRHDKQAFKDYHAASRQPQPPDSRWPLAACWSCGTLATGLAGLKACPVCSTYSHILFTTPTSAPAPPPEPCALFIQDASPLFPTEALTTVQSLPSAAQFEVLFDCCSWLTAAWAAFARHSATSTRFIVSIPIHLNGHVIWFYDDQPSPLKAIDSAQASYRIASHAPGHRLWLSRSTPMSSPAIWPPLCPRSLGLPSPLAAQPAQCFLPLPRTWAQPPHRGAGLALHSVCRGVSPGQRRSNSPRTPGLPCYSPDHTLLHPSTPWALALAADTFSPLHLHRHPDLTFLTWNVGGVEALVDYVCNMRITLDIDFFAVQELWSFNSILTALPSHYATYRSTADGCRTGTLVGWRLSLQHPSTRPRVQYDSHDLLVALMRHHTVGFVLIASVHIHPELD